MFTAQQIAQATGAPLANVEKTWPAVLAALQWQGINTRNTRIAMIGTIVVETGITVNGQNMTFLPVAELGGAQARYAPWYGRGLIQCTWEANYSLYGPLLNPPLNLLANPDLLITDVVASAQMAALYFVDRGIPTDADAENWLEVRIKVNGGTTGYPIYIAAVNAMLAVSEAPPVTKVAVAGELKQSPALGANAALDTHHTPVTLPVGQVVVFAPDPHTKQETTPHWACVKLPNSPVWGWFPRSSLATTGG